MTVSAPQPINSQTLPFLAALLDKNGRLTFPWLKYFQGLQSAQKTIAQSFDTSGSLQAPVGAQTTLAVRGITFDTLLAHITNAGLLDSLTSIAADVDTDHIADGTGSPLAGGKIAYAAMVTSGPLTGQILVYDGAHWLPHAKANTIAAGLHEWLKSYDSSNGNFTQTQPDFTDLSGRAALTQLGSGTPGAGKYVDGGSGAWTALPGGGTSLFNEQVAQVAGVFTLAHVPVSDGAGNPALVLYNGSARLFPGLSNDYTISGAAITPNYSIPAGSLWADYQY